MSTDKTHDDFISVYMPIAGWKAIWYSYNTTDIPGEGFWEPWETGNFAYLEKENAVTDAKKWAEDLGLEFRDTAPENNADAPDESVAEQLRKICGDTVTIIER